MRKWFQELFLSHIQDPDLAGPLTIGTLALLIGLLAVLAPRGEVPFAAVLPALLWTPAIYFGGAFLVRIILSFLYRRSKYPRTEVIRAIDYVSWGWLCYTVFYFPIKLPIVLTVYSGEKILDSGTTISERILGTNDSSKALPISREE